MTSAIVGKSILSLTAVFTSVGPYLVDFNHTHVYNPRWPPHARFHNGQTMSTGLLIGLSSLFFIHKPSTPSATSVYNLNIALFLIHLYYVPSLSGGLYPGALFTDPEFGPPTSRPQLPAFTGTLALSWLGWYLTRRGLHPHARHRSNPMRKAL